VPPPAPGRAVAHKPAYLIAGGDWPKIDAAATRLRAQFRDEVVEQITIGAEDALDPVAVCCALGLFAGERLVLVRGVEGLDADGVQAIIEYLKDPTPDTCLALFGGEGVDAKGPLAKAVGAVGDVRFFDPPDEKHAVQWVVKRFSERGLTCPVPVARRLVELIGEGIGDLSLEVDKLSTHCLDRDPELADVDLLVVPERDVKPWDITDAWGRRDAGRVIDVAMAGVERADEVPRIVGQMANHVRKVRQALVLLEAGSTQADVQKALNLNPYPAKKLCEQARRFSEPELAAAIVRLARLDLDVKGGSRLDPRLELELALAEITAAA